MRVWMNGEMLPDATAPAVTVADHGLTVGDGVFEAIKVVDGRPFALTRHLDRLATSAAGLGLPVVDDAAVRRGVAAVLEGDPLALGRIRITYTGGPAPLGSGRGDAAPTVVVVAAAMTPFAETTTVATVPWPRNEKGALAGLKTTSYAENVVALARAQEQGATEAIFANLAGHLCEGTGSNVFYVVDGELRTPTLALRLPGRRHPCAAPGVVRRARGRRAGRGRPRRERGVPRVDHPGRPGRLAVGRPRAPRTGPGHHRGTGPLEGARARAARRLTSRSARLPHEASPAISRARSRPVTPGAWPGRPHR